MSDYKIRTYLKRIRFELDGMLYAASNPEEVSKEETEKVMTANEIRGYSDQDLSNNHMKLHSLWTMYRKGKSIGKYNRSLLVSLHNAIVKEISKRNLKHSYISDLDDSLPSDLKKITEGTKEFELEKKKKGKK